MSPEESTTSAHAAVRNELLVRYLDAWLPQVLHGHKRVTYVDCSPDPSSAVAAARVICEFEDLLRRHAVTMAVSGIASADEVIAEPPAGLEVRPVAGPMLTALRDAHAVGTPTFAFVRQPVPGDLLSTVASTKASELMLYGDPALEVVLRKAGLGFVSQVEFVDASGRAELLMFGAAAQKSVEKFKDELWALDEYAGIRLRDPRDAKGTLLDISVQPQLGPLRRAMLARIAETGGATLAELRRWAVQETIYRAADATKAVQALITTGLATREPISGRLSPDTVIKPLAEVDDSSEGSSDELDD
jgi:hypothetical protein